MHKACQLVLLWIAYNPCFDAIDSSGRKTRTIFLILDSEQGFLGYHMVCSSSLVLKEPSGNSTNWFWNTKLTFSCSCRSVDFRLYMISLAVVLLFEKSAFYLIKVPFFLEKSIFLLKKKPFCLINVPFCLENVPFP